MIGDSAQNRTAVNYDYYERRAHKLRSAAFWSLLQALFPGKARHQAQAKPSLTQRAMGSVSCPAQP